MGLPRSDISERLQLLPGAAPIRGCECRRPVLIPGRAHSLSGGENTGSEHGVSTRLSPAGLGGSFASVISENLHVTREGSSVSDCTNEEAGEAKSADNVCVSHLLSISITTILDRNVPSSPKLAKPRLCFSASEFCPLDLRPLFSVVATGHVRLWSP